MMIIYLQVQPPWCWSPASNILIPQSPLKAIVSQWKWKYPATLWPVSIFTHISHLIFCCPFSIFSPVYIPTSFQSLLGMNIYFPLTGKVEMTINSLKKNHRHHHHHHHHLRHHHHLTSLTWLAATSVGSEETLPRREERFGSAWGQIS